MIRLAPEEGEDAAEVSLALEDDAPLLGAAGFIGALSPWLRRTSVYAQGRGTGRASVSPLSATIALLPEVEAGPCAASSRLRWSWSGVLISALGDVAGGASVSIVKPAPPLPLLVA